MLLLLPILVPLIGGIFVFRQKNDPFPLSVFACRRDK